MTKFSQNNEQYWISNYFGNTIGTVMTIGENDGITLSNTWPLFQAGWSGVAVEASPKAFDRLLQNHARTIAHDRIQCIHAAVTDFNGTITLYESGQHLGKGDVSLLSSIDKSETERWTKEAFTEVVVPAINFNMLMGLSRYKTFDFITIDCEGCELCMLEQMDLKALGCKLLCVEYNGKDKHLYDAIVLPQGYRLLHKNGENLIYEVV